MPEKTIRIWNGPTVVQVVSVSNNGGSGVIGATGGAHNSGKVDIEIDPWAGLIVDHSTSNSPVSYREPER